jgi:hypothetical protein
MSKTNEQPYGMLRKPRTSLSNRDDIVASEDGRDAV